MTERDRDSRTLEERAAAIQQIRVDLKLQCAKIPQAAWSLFEDKKLPLGAYSRSKLLPEDKSDRVDAKGRPFHTPQAIDHDEVEIFLDEHGVIWEKLVHYSSDGYDSDKESPDEILGEPSDENLEWSYLIAIRKLDHLKKRAAELFPDVA